MRSGPQVGKVATSPLPSRACALLQSGGGGGSEVPHLWAMWLRHPCRLGDPHRFRAGWGGNEKGPTSGQTGYVTPAVSGIPTAAERGGEIRIGPLVGKVAMSPLPSRGSPPMQTGGKSEVAHKWAKWLRHPCRLGYPHRFRAGSKIRSGPLMGKVATSCLPSRGCPPLQSGGGIRSGPQVGKLATSPLPSRGSPPLQSGGQNQKWPTCGGSGYVTPAFSGIPTA